MERICIMTSVHPHDDVRVFHRQAQSLRAAGYEVMMICPDFEGEQGGISCLRVPLPHDRLGRMHRASSRFYTAARRQHCDCYHIHDPELLPAALRLRRTGHRVIYDAHEDLPLQLQDKHWIPQLLRKPLAWAAGRWEERAAAKMSACIAATDDIAARLAGAVVVRNYPQPYELERPFEPFVNRPRQVVYVGSITRSRGMITMAEAVSHTDGQLVLAGRLEDMHDFQKLCNLSGGGIIDYQGVLGRGEVADLLAQSRVGLLLLHPTPAYQRSLPIKLFEYMLAGLPVIASDFPLWRELAGEDCALYVNPIESADVAAAIQTLLDDPQRCEAMGRAGQQRALQHYCYDTEQKTLLSLYKSILSAEVNP